MLHRHPSVRTRNGNAIVAALAVFTVAAMLVATATDSSIATAESARQITLQQRGLAALDAVLARHQLDVVEMANLGDPTIISDVSRWKDGRNYGADFIGDTEVRWKIEPVCTPPNDPTPVLPTYPNGSPINFITNPCPDSNWVTPSSHTNWQANDNNYMFRVSAEARVQSKKITNPDGTYYYEPTAVVQGARYASVNKEPLFRYVIFYAQQGPKGDLELSHADPVKIQGAVHTNGALYIGSGLKVNDKMLRLGSLDGNLHPTSTIIGPDAPDAPKTPNPVRVNGVDGIFRLSKPLMYAIMNGFPLTDGSNTSIYGNAESSSFGALSWAPGSSYNLATSPQLFPTETAQPNLTSVNTATNYGQIINPYRILDGSGAITESLFTGQVYNSDGTTMSGPDNWRMICAKPGVWVPMRGMSGPGGYANDSRDAERAAASTKWKQASLLPTAPGFNGMARTKETGQGVKRLPSVLANQGLEPQSLNYYDYDANALTDQHEYARPLFMKADGTRTTDYPGAPSTSGWPTWAVVEACGQYLRYALGASDTYMGRYNDGTGWFVRKIDGSLPSDPATTGLIIRERPIPDTAYWPGSTGGTIVDSNDLHWLPFAYGKHWYPNLAPFTVADISDQVYPGSSDPYTNRINTSSANRIVSYGVGGRLSLTTAQNPSQSSNNPYAGVSDYSYTRRPYYYGQNWRFAHLKKATATSTAGLLLSLFNDRPTGTNSQSLCSDPVTVTAPATSIVSTVSFSGVTPVPNGRYSARFEGFITPTTTNTYEFSASTGSNQYAKVWINGQLIWSNWGLSQQYPNPLCSVRLGAGVAVPIQVDWCSNNGGAPSLGLTWHVIDTLPIPAFTTVPSSVLTTRSSVAFTRSEFTAVEMRIDRPQSIAGAANRKIGLMVRDAVGGMSPLLNGTAPYAFVGWSPTRGFFVERRVVRHLQNQATVGTYYIGNGSDSASNACDALGQVGESSTSVAGVNRTAVLTENAAARTSWSATYGPYYGPSNISYGGTSWTTAPTFTGTMSRDVGGGKVWTLLDSFSYGQRSATRTAQPYSYTQVGAGTYTTMTLQLSGQAGPFFPYDPNNTGTALDHNQTLRLFNANTGTGQYTTNNAQGTLYYSATYAPLTAGVPPYDGRWYFFGASGGSSWLPSTSYALAAAVINGGNRYTCIIAGTSAGSGGPTGTAADITDGSAHWKYLGASTASSSPYTQMRRTFGSESYPTNYNWGTTTTLTATAGDSNTIWGSTRINKNGVVTSNASLADINTVTGAGFTAMNPTLPTLTLASPVYPALPAAPAIPTVTLALPDFSTGRTFQTQRAGGTVNFDLNSFVTGSGTWFTTAVAQYLPWTSSITAWSAIVPPNTQGFRPDVWAGATAPVLGTPAAGIATTSGSPTGYVMSDDIKPANNNTATEIWLRIEQSGSTLHYKYFCGSAKPTGPTDAGWVEIFPTTAPTDISGWSSGILAGPALQSGDVNTSLSATLTNLSVTTSAAAPNDVIDYNDWDQAGSGASAMVKYLCSQYQVFWGAREITEDFFKWVNPSTGAGIASEDWVWNPREFWSQSRWWDFDYPNGTSPASMIEKDIPVSPKTTFNSTTIREALGKVTMLTLDMRNLQDYLSSRSLSQAIAYMIGSTASGGNDYNFGWPALAPSDDYVLKNHFNGLIYAVRTNRYPWNPNLPKWTGSPLSSPLEKAIDAGSAGGSSKDGINPWSPVYATKMPNSGALVDSVQSNVANRTNLNSWTDSDLIGPGGVHKLQPYLANVLPEAPALKPQEFHHGIRIVNGASIDWGYSGAKSSTTTRSIGTSGTVANTWSWSTPPTFGTSKTSIVTPNSLVVQGNLNVDQHLCPPQGGGTPVAKFTPLAIMGDAITFESNAWKDSDYQVPGVTVTNTAGSTSVGGTGSLACSTIGAFASDTEFNAAIATHNQPSTRERVAEGQSAPFIDATQFIENWNGRTMSYLGSLVVMDSRRYTRSFLLDSYKTYGQTPFGIVGSTSWLGVFNGMQSTDPATGTAVSTPLYGYSVTAADWLGQSPIVYSEPIRVYRFNYDLTTPEGTPPFAPFGVSAAGIGGWARAVR